MSYSFGSNRINFPKSETILVANGDLALASGALIPASGSVAGISNGQLGLLSAAPNQSIAQNSFLTAGKTVATDRFVKFIQGTPGSANIAGVESLPISHQAWLESPVIDGRNAIAFSAKASSLGRYSAWIIGSTTASAAINVASNTQYNINIGFQSVRKDRRYSITGLEMYTPYYTTPDYTALGLNATQSLDHLVHNLVYNINVNSRALGVTAPAQLGNKDVLAFGISFAGGVSGGYDINDASPIAVGDVLNVTSIGGVMRTYTATQEFVNTLTELNANSTDIVDASEIVPINLANAGTLALDGILLISIDGEQSFVKDTVREKRTRLFVGLEDGFNSSSVRKVEGSTPVEAQGLGRDWLLQWETRNGLNIWTEQNHPRGDYRIEVPNYIDTTKQYTAYIIESMSNGMVPYSHVTNNGHRVILLVPFDDADAGATDATTLASLNAIVGPWLASAPNQEAFLTSGTSPNFFI